MVGSIVYILFYVGISIGIIISTALNIDNLRMRAKTPSKEDIEVGSCKTASKNSNPPFTIINALNILKQIVAVFQFVTLAIKSSTVLVKTTFVANNLGAIRSRVLFLPFLVANVLTLLWVAAARFLLIGYPVLMKKYPTKLIRYTSVISIIVMFVTNYATIFLISVAEIMLQVFECNFNEKTGKFVSSFDPENFQCYAGVHWVAVYFAFAIFWPFLYYANRYAREFDVCNP